MWRFIAVSGSILLFAFTASSAAADDGSTQCEGTYHTECTTYSATSLPFYGVHTFGLGAPSGEFITGDAHTWQIIEDTEPRRAEFDDEAITVIQLHDEDVHYTPRQRRDDVHISLRQATVDRPRHDALPTHTTPFSSESDDHTVLRLHGDEQAQTPMAASVGEEETVIRIHGDEAEINGNPVDDEDTQFFPDDDVDEQEDDEVDEPAEIATGYVDWKFIPVVEVLEATGGVTPVDAQRMLERDIEAITSCFEPDGYDADGAVDVDLHLAHTGRPHSVNGSTDGVRPTQARCILQRAWGYEFPRPAEQADDPSRVRYRVEFVAQTVDAPTVDPDQAQFLLERLILDDHRQLEDAATNSLVRHLDDAESCAVQSLEALPEEFVVTEVDARWMRTDGYHYRPTDLDITVSNETSTELPPPQVVDCYRRALREWDFDVSDANVEVHHLPDILQGSFFITLRPAGW